MKEIIKDIKVLIMVNETMVQYLERKEPSLATTFLLKESTDRIKQLTAALKILEA